MIEPLPKFPKFDIKFAEPLYFDFSLKMQISLGTRGRIWFSCESNILGFLTTEIQNKQSYLNEL